LDAGTGISNNPLTTYTAYQWYTIDQTGEHDIVGATGQTLLVTTVGSYGVRLTSQFCEITDETDIGLECEPVIAAPNAFRPTSSLKVGGEFVNKQFKLFTFFIEDTDFQIYIYNRWGEMVFQSPERDFAWNGGYRNDAGDMLPAGTYTYVVRYRSTYRPEYGVREKRGGVVLVR
jgi:gliding motility-associated-like protein